MENIEQNIEQSEVQEEIKIENAVETSEKTDEDAFDVWVRTHIGEKDLTDAYKLVVKGFRYAGKFKLKYIAYAIKYIGYGIGFILGLLMLYGIYSGVTHIFDMMTDDTDSYSYALFDSDLWATVIISVIVVCYSFWAWDKGTKGFFYFIFLVAMVEYWNYSFLETHDTNPILGGACFFLFFLIIPALLIIKSYVDLPKEQPMAEELENKQETA
ncbi:MAG: hypothetical protein LBS55_07325 [Prevotellaceae bacterium]|nr:hypothetical protein [Prevotellaceae bacterium]